MTFKLVKLENLFIFIFKLEWNKKLKVKSIAFSNLILPFKIFLQCVQHRLFKKRTIETLSDRY